MTIRSRNRLDFSIFIVSSVLFVFNLTFLLIKAIKGNLNFDDYAQFKVSQFFLTRYNPYITMGTIFFENLFVVVVSYIVLHIFEKTQASDVIFFCLFLVSCLLDSFRLWIPLFSIYQTYSRFLFFLGNVILFGKILLPFSILLIVIYGELGSRPDIEKYLLIILVAAAFMAYLIPLNSSILSPNFAVDFSAKKLITIITIVTILASLVAEVFINIKQMHTQKTTIGLALLCIGILLLNHAINILAATISAAALISGTILFLHELHNQYLFND